LNKLLIDSLYTLRKFQTLILFNLRSWSLPSTLGNTIFCVIVVIFFKSILLIHSKDLLLEGCQ
jgi:hypothetical protein